MAGLVRKGERTCHFNKKDNGAGSLAFLSRRVIEKEMEVLS